MTMIVYAREGASFLVRNGDSVWKIFLEGHNWDFPAVADVGNEGAKGNSAALAAVKCWSYEQRKLPKVNENFRIQGFEKKG